jgi:hypothetical protein
MAPVRPPWAGAIDGAAAARAAMSAKDMDRIMVTER